MNREIDDTNDRLTSAEKKCRLLTRERDAAKRKADRKATNYKKFLSATEYHSDADYNSRRVGVVVVVVVVVVYNFKNGLTFERLDRFASYLEGSCTRVSRFASYAYVMIGPYQLAQPAY